MESQIRPYTSESFRKVELPWLEEGLRELAYEGTAHFKIDSLSRKTGISRTSFYHLFESREAFLRRLCEYWIYIGTLKYFQELEPITDPKLRMIGLVKMIYKDRIEGMAWLSFKHLGRKDEMIKKMVDTLEAKRLEVVSGYILDLGYDRETARNKGILFMYFFFGQLVLRWSESKSDTMKPKEIAELFERIGIELD